MRGSVCKGKPGRAPRVKVNEKISCLRLTQHTPGAVRLSYSSSWVPGHHPRDRSSQLISQRPVGATITLWCSSATDDEKFPQGANTDLSVGAKRTVWIGGGG